MQTKYSPSEYVKHIREGLDILKAEVSDPLLRFYCLYASSCISTTQLPRTFVNLVQILDVTELEDLKGSLLCSAVKL